MIAHHLEGGIDLRDAWGCTVSANTFVLVNRHSLRISPKSGRITATGNTFCNSDIGGETKRPKEHEKLISRDLAYGVLLEGTSDIVLTGNVFSGLRNSAVTTQGKCERVVLAGNVIREVDTDKGGRRPVESAEAGVFVESANIGASDRK